MKVSRIVLAFVLAGFAASVALADGADPLISVRKVDPAPIAITSPDQTFDIFVVAGAGATALFAFQNDTGITLTSLTLNLGAGLTYSCESDFQSFDVFSSCTSSGPSGSTIVFSGVGGVFSGLTAATCISDDEGSGDDWNGSPDNNDDDKPSCTGGVFSIEFAGLTPGEVVSGTGTVSAPEPMTAVLLFSGLVGLAGFRKRRIA